MKPTKAYAIVQKATGITHVSSEPFPKSVFPALFFMHVTGTFTPDKAKGKGGGKRGKSK